MVVGLGRFLVVEQKSFDVVGEVVELGFTKTGGAFGNQFSSKRVILNGSSSVSKSSNGRRGCGGVVEAVEETFG